ncbi:hypothetical protein VNO78_01172 [Psophocarpus tetragonolobus]|uniref:Uncharacterized protein n=1 Tax=Psophocarpus tetragonolobus TaxID=3891 RepID=A0AAN9T055_PSOTE
MVGVVAGEPKLAVSIAVVTLLSSLLGSTLSHITISPFHHTSCYSLTCPLDLSIILPIFHSSKFPKCPSFSSFPVLAYCLLPTAYCLLPRGKPA